MGKRTADKNGEKARPVTIADVARYAECSTTTVSFVLNHHTSSQRISEVTRQRILDAIGKLNYVPNTFAKNLRTINVQNIGILCTDITDPFCGQVLQGIMNYLHETNYFYQLVDVQNDPRQLEQFFNLARGQHLEGIIGILNTLTLDLAELARYIEPQMKFVGIGRAIPELNTPIVGLDNREGVRLGVRHLYDLGHREIAFIFGPDSIEDSVIRRQGILEICQELGIRCRRELMAHITRYPVNAQDGQLAIREILKRKIPFTAVFTFDDYTAYGAIQELTRHGVRVPQDVSVIGFDDIWLSSAYNPPLTTICHPMVELGWKGAESVVSMIQAGQNGGQHLRGRDIILKPTLVVRESTAPKPA